MRSSNQGQYTPDTIAKTYTQTKRNKDSAIYAATDTSDILPDKIRLEKDRQLHQGKGFNLWFYIRNTSNWRTCQKTGLRPIGIPNCYYADLYLNGKKTLLVVQISKEKFRATAHVARGFYPKHGRTAPQIARRIIQREIEV